MNSGYGAGPMGNNNNSNNNNNNNSNNRNNPTSNPNHGYQSGGGRGRSRRWHRGDRVNTPAAFGNPSQSYENQTTNNYGGPAQWQSMPTQHPHPMAFGGIPSTWSVIPPRWPSLPALQAQTGPGKRQRDDSDDSSRPAKRKVHVAQFSDVVSEKPDSEERMTDVQPCGRPRDNFIVTDENRSEVSLVNPTGNNRHETSRQQLQYHEGQLQDGGHIISVMKTVPPPGLTARSIPSHPQLCGVGGRGSNRNMRSMRVVKAQTTMSGNSMALQPQQLLASPSMGNMDNDTASDYGAAKALYVGGLYCLNCEKDTHIVVDCVGPPNWSHGDLAICTLCGTMDGKFDGHQLDDCKTFQDILKSHNIPQGVTLNPELMATLDDDSISLLFSVLVLKRVRKPCVRSRYVDWVDVLMEASRRFHGGKQPGHLTGYPWPKEFSRTLSRQGAQRNAGTGGADRLPWETYHYALADTHTLPFGGFEAMDWDRFSKKCKYRTLTPQIFISTDRKRKRNRNRQRASGGVGGVGEAQPSDINEEIRRLREENERLRMAANQTSN